MVSVSENMWGSVKYTNILLTRGDDIVLEMPLYKVNPDGTRQEYTPVNTDTFLIQVRQGPVTGAGNAPAIVFTGAASISSGRLRWSITHSNSTQNCGKYYYDVQMTQNDGKVYTPYQGWLEILPESSIVAS